MRKSLIVIFFIISSQLYSQTLVFNELMARPQKGGAEYVELANLSDHPISLDAFSLALLAKDGTTKGKRHSLPKGISVPPLELFVLTEDKQDILFRYPKASESLVFELDSWPRLSDNGCTIALLEYDSGKHTVHDYASHTKALYPYGLKSAYGYALEKKSPSLKSHVLSNWAVPLEKPYASPTWYNSIASSEDGEWIEDENTDEFSSDKDADDGFSPKDLAHMIVSHDCPVLSVVYDLRGLQQKRFGDYQTRLWAKGLLSRTSLSRLMGLKSGLYILYVSLKDADHYSTMIKIVDQ
ncbi:MAG: lamin tail domain-containing protein [Porphyromonadaceae bacterium]|nr:lamin tail domain-containing protein [Porphyromonadaceae bacterium]